MHGHSQFFGGERKESKACSNASWQIYFKSTDVYNERWQNAWIILAFWHVLSFSLLCIICALWAPSQNTMR